jgi:DNA-binding transcriptional LysR family regulator
MAVASEVHQRSDIRLLRFAPPGPKREIDLAWRETSLRKPDFHAFAALVKASLDAPANPDWLKVNGWQG